MTFNGTAYTGNEGDIETKALIFADKCDSHNFVMTQGQALHILGNLTGSLEVLIDTVNMVATTTTIFYFYDTNGMIFDEVTRAEIMAVAPFDLSDLPNYDQERFFVYAKHGTYDICARPCPAMPML